MSRVWHDPTTFDGDGWHSPLDPPSQPKTTQGKGAPASMSTTGGRKRIPELSAIELRSTSGVADYCSASRNLARDFASELDSAGQELHAALTRMHGHPLAFGIDVRMKSRKIRRRIHRARDLQLGVGIEMVKAWHTFRAEFGPVLDPPKAEKRAVFDFKN